jgi:hypothetical protein
MPHPDTNERYWHHIPVYGRARTMGTAFTALAGIRRMAEFFSPGRKKRIAIKTSPGNIVLIFVSYTKNRSAGYSSWN